ncbi:MAG: hypothetical protein CL868_04810 [Cytophagaceae bacterium]|nr:hypothetical protein [Cytophagaceae bacterium]
MAQELIIHTPSNEAPLDSVYQLLTFKKIRGLEEASRAAHTLNDSLQKMGFITSTVDSLKRMGNNYVAFLNPGKKTQYILARYTDMILETYSDELNLRHENKKIWIPFNQTTFILKRFNLLEAKNGRPLSMVSLENIKNKDTLLVADVVLNRSKTRKLDSIAIVGYEKFPRSFITLGTGLKTGKIFDQVNIASKLDLLNDLNFADVVKPAEILFRESETIAYTYLEKKSANRLDGFLGFGTNEETGKLRINGNLEIRLLNNLNYGESLEINYRGDGNDQRALDAHVQLPYILRTPVGLTAGINLFRKDSTFSTTSQNLELLYKINNRLHLNAGLKHETSSRLNSINLINIKNYSKNFITTGIVFLNPSNNPLTGNLDLIRLSAGVGSRKTEGARTPQGFVDGTFERTFRINSKYHFFLRNNTQALFSKNYFDNELYRFGGMQTIRGFAENSLVAGSHTSFMSEFRYIPVNGLVLNSIFDASYYENDLVNDFIYSAGAGISLLTASSVLKINVANPISNSGFKFSDTIFHISVIALF